MNALLLIDIQNDFLPGGALAVPDGDAVIPIANRLAAERSRFGAVFATRDDHPAGHRSFASSHPGRRLGEVIDLDGLSQVLWPDHCVQGTRGSELAPSLALDSIDEVVSKGTDASIDSYSGFFDNGHRRATGLADRLRARGVSSVYVLGLATDYCVKFTALDARQLGFEVFVVEDACRGVNLAPGDAERALAQMERAGVRRVRSADLLSAPMAGPQEPPR